MNNFYRKLFKNICSANNKGTTNSFNTISINQIQ